jgi:hypothetical protein
MCVHRVGLCTYTTYAYDCVRGGSVCKCKRWCLHQCIPCYIMWSGGCLQNISKDLEVVIIGDRWSYKWICCPLYGALWQALHRTTLWPTLWECVISRGWLPPCFWGSSDIFPEMEQRCFGTIDSSSSLGGRSSFTPPMLGIGSMDAPELGKDGNLLLRKV